MSDEHKKWLQKQKRHRLNVRFWQFLIALIFIGGWQLLASFNLINTFIFSSPLLICKTIIYLFNDGSLFKHIGVTMGETMISFFLGSGLGLLIASIMWWKPTVAKIIDPYLTIINSLPKVALGPILIIWVGANMRAIIVMTLLISLIITIMHVYEGFKKTDPNMIKLMQSFKASNYQIFFKVVIPANIPTILSALRINISMSLIGIIMGELLVSKAGIGYLIMYGSQVFNLNLVMTGIFLLGVIAVLLYYIVNRLTKDLVDN
jgi:NitT/TauT family transport system permease protein